MIRLCSTEAEGMLDRLEARRRDAETEAFRVADAAIAGVRERGDAYVAEQVAKFDGVTMDPASVLCGSGLQPASLSPGVLKPAATLEREIGLAIERIESFHLAQLPSSYEWRRDDTRIEHRVRPLRRVGIYVPGGRAVYLSTLIMCAVPARIAGVGELVVATTPRAAATPELQAVCQLLGVREIYRAGGPAAIAAMALGTATLRRVDKIVGPGNAYVTAAKARLIGEVGIDMTAGPTELVTIADDTANTGWLAADLAAQAEHGPDSAVILATTSERVAQEVAATLGGRVAIFLAESLDEAVALANRLAPEHLSIMARDAGALAARAESCGAIYCGPWSAPAAGDYLTGSNHVLPTGGSARFFSPLGVYDFVKRSNVVFAGENDAKSIAEAVNAIATFEGLPAHGASAICRRDTRVPAGETPALRGPR